MEKDYTKGVNVDDLDPPEVIDKKFEMMSAECAKEMAKNYGAPDAFANKKGKGQQK